MVEVNEALTRKVADLARLELTEAELKTFTGQLKTILNYVEQLNEADVGKVEPMTQPWESATPLREDKHSPSPLAADGKPKVLEHAPEVLDDGFKVPPIL